MEKISGVVITLNEENNVEDCIKSLQNVCDEVLVIDSLSKDNTVEIAKQNGAIVIEQEYLGDGPQKAFGVPKAKNDWILCIDADERLDADSLKMIPTLDYTNPKKAYAFKRKNYVGNHWVKAAGFYPDYVTRLYNRNEAGYLEKKSHSKVMAPKIVKTRCHLIHYTYKDFSHWMERLNWLSSRDAWAHYEKGTKPSKIRPVTSALAAFLRKFIFKGGFLQGIDGCTVTLTTIIRAYMKYMKLNEMYEKKKNDG